MTLSELNIDEDIFDIFLNINATHKIEFLSDAMEFGAEAAMSKQIERLAIEFEDVPKMPIVSSQDFMSGDYRLCVTTLKDEIQLNSDSLKTIRKFILKLFMDGLILSPLDTKKSEMDMYRHFKAYKVLGRGNSISLS
tara:strand:+ start:1171 stop:1581 length:411 start_codon:yes stop_codon:yes gene_type:complete